MHLVRSLTLCAGLLLAVPPPTPAAPQGGGPDSPTSADGTAAARQAIHRHDFEEAERILGALVERKPDHAKAWFLLGYTLQMLGRFEEARDADLRAAQWRITRSSALYNAACACARMGRIDEAFEHLAAAVEAGFHNPPLLAEDPDLDPLRKDPRFAPFLEPKAPSKFLDPDVPVLFMFEGEAATDQFGWEGRGAGDVDGDGVQDLVVSAPYHDAADGPHGGKVYVYSGKTGKLLFARTGESNEYLGIGLDAAGDLNRDGHADILVGAPRWSRGDGRAYVFSGANGETILTLQSPATNDDFGWKVACAGDWDEDGRPEYLVGAPGNNDPDSEDPGRAYLFSGRDGSLLWSGRGEDGGDAFGSSVAAWKSKGPRLFAVGAANSGPRDRGRVYLYRFEQSGVRLALTFEADETGASLGRFVSFPGDVDGDGCPDLYASDWENCARGRCTGRVYVYSGCTGEPVLTLTGESAGDGFGSGPAAAGDVDGDGCADLIVGAWRSNEGGLLSGQVYLYSGRTGKTLRTYTSRVPLTTFGFDAVGVGDLNGDGGGDFLITGAWSRGKGEKSGRAFVIAGPIPPRLPTVIEARFSASER